MARGWLAFGLAAALPLAACDRTPTATSDEAAVRTDAGPAEETDAVTLAEQTIDNAMAASADTGSNEAAPAEELPAR